MKRDDGRGEFSAAINYLPDEIGAIVPAQWKDIHRPWRPSDAPEGRLLLAILEQALIDLREGTMLERRSAKNWLLRPGEGFDAICELFGFDADAIRKKLLAENNP
ncbi:MAG TPA: hypothetical protein VL754_21465 [Verrucomicrobiae bacterium]|nr:hypothetical protein [Verrucomicrobiae bacterium]